MYPLAIFGLGPPELILLFLIILIIFGAGKIPQIGASLGKGIRNFRTGVKGQEDEAASTAPKDPPNPA